MKAEKKFWNWIAQEDQDGERTLFIDGAFAEGSWIYDDVTPEMFRRELYAGSGPVTIWINSPGGDVFAAAQIYNMIREYPGKVTIKIDGIAASAASVIAMAGDVVLMSPVAMMMIHNPWTYASGDADEFGSVIAQLEAVKETIINAYQLKTGMSRDEISKLMDEETFFDVNWAIEHKFADGMTERRQFSEEITNKTKTKFSDRVAVAEIKNKLRKAPEESPKEPKEEPKVKVVDLRVELAEIKSKIKGM